MKTHKYSPNLGFSLAELMIVVAIVGILAAIAYPSYQESVRKTRRADARAGMVELAQWMERFYTENHRYDQTNDATPVAVSPPTKLTQSPKEGTTKYYNITLSNLAQNTFTINAAPISGGAQADDKCGTLTLKHTGERNVSGAHTGVTADDCW